MLERVATSVSTVRDGLARDPVETDRMLREQRIMGLVSVTFGTEAHSMEDRQLDELLTARLAEGATPHAWSAPPSLCFRGNTNSFSERTVALSASSLPKCWLVEFRDPHGSLRRVAVIQPRLNELPNLTGSPIFLTVTVLASALLSFLVTRLMTTPLRQLTDAARTFSLSIDPESVAERGPHEVRAAMATFNLMQYRIRDGFRERTQVLAGIAHDLQTPLTRLRLRLEHVSDIALRERLIGDLAATQRLVRDGLDLARSTESREEWSVVDLDSLLSSIAEDASDAGSDVRFDGCGAVQVRVKPNALVRCLTNLVDNAVKYGERAELSCKCLGLCIDIGIRDFGPGIEESKIARMFEPFERGDTGRLTTTLGTGIGLTIARAQARTFGGRVSLHNHPDGGLIATISIPLQAH
jgi:signal transduction histidine kinase